MKYTVNLIIKYIAYGLSWGCTCFVMMCLALFLTGGETLLSPILKDFARQAIGAILVGIACGSTAIVYQCQNLSSLAQTIIHFVVGMGVFYPVAIRLGWIPFYPDKLYTILQFLLSCVVFMAIWSCFYLFNRKEAKRINDRLKELENEEDESKPDRL